MKEERVVWVLFALLAFVGPAWGQEIDCAGHDECQPSEQCLDGRCQQTRLVIRAPDRPAGERGNRLDQIHLRYRVDGLAFSDTAFMRVSRYESPGDDWDHEANLVGSLCTTLPQWDHRGVENEGVAQGDDVLDVPSGDGFVYALGVTHLPNELPDEDVEEAYRVAADNSRRLQLRLGPAFVACEADVDYPWPADHETIITLELFDDLESCEAEARPRGTLAIGAVCSTSYVALGVDNCVDRPPNAEEGDSNGALVALDSLWTPYVEGPVGRPAFNCRELKPNAARLALILDDSGSMGAFVSDGNGGGASRIHLLSASVKSLFQVWRKWRSTLEEDARADDRAGVVLFSTDARPIEALCAGRRALNLTPTAMEAAADNVDGYIDCLLEGGNRQECADEDAAANDDAAADDELSGIHMRPFDMAALDFIGMGRGGDATPPGQGLCDHPQVAEAGEGADIERASAFLPVGGATSFGDGLALAMGRDFLDLANYQREFVGLASEHWWRNVILFISDGRHNTPCGYDISANGVISFTDCGEQPTYNLRDERQRHLAQVHTIAIDAGGGAASEDMERLATLSGGTHHHIDTLEGATEDALREFFLDILQNTLRFNTWHVAQRVAIDNGQIELSGTWVDDADDEALSGPMIIQDELVPVHVPTTAKAVSLVAWWKGDVTVQLDVWPPNSRQPITRRSDSGHIEFVIHTRTDWHDPAEPWRFRLQVVPENPDPDEEPPPLAHARALVFVDHDQLQPYFKIHGPLSREQGGVRITTRLEAFGRPVDVGEGGRVYVNAKRPDASLMTQLMAACDAPELREMLDEIELRHLLGRDVGSMLTELVAACREAHPDLMTRSWYQVEMRDDGDGADLTAGDGVYSARFPGQDLAEFYEGHYQIYINVDGADSQIGRFQLSHQQTVFVPQGVAPSPVDQDVQNAPGNAVRNPGARGVIERIAEITVTPRDMLGNPIGPGRGGYLWLRFDDDEISPRLLQDNLDGTYTASFSIGADDEIPHGEVVFIQKPIQLPVGVAPEVMIEHIDGPAGGPVLDAKGNPLVQLGRFGGFFEPPPIDGDFSGCACSVDGSGDLPGSGVLMVLVGLMALRRRRRESRER